MHHSSQARTRVVARTFETIITGLGKKGEKKTDHVHISQKKLVMHGGYLYIENWVSIYSHTPLRLAINRHGC